MRLENTPHLELV